jgi:GT2 family glycosyltransferase
MRHAKLHVRLAAISLRSDLQTCLATDDQPPILAVMPVVSVVMYFHRVTPFLQPAVRSVLGQTFTDCELVLVDNGVGISAAALGESGRDPRVRLISLPRNVGIAGGHNAAVAAAQGEYNA